MALTIPGRKLASALRAFGHAVVRPKGSPLRLRAPGRPSLTIPDHHELETGTLKAISRDAGITEAELLPPL